MRGAMPRALLHRGALHSLCGSFRKSPHFHVRTFQKTIRLDGGENDATAPVDRIAPDAIPD
jgi:hypothetical protein